MRRQRRAEAVGRDSFDAFVMIVRLLQCRCVVGQQVTRGGQNTTRFRGFTGFDIDSALAQLAYDFAGDISLADIGIGAGNEIAIVIEWNHASILCKLITDCKHCLL